MSIQISSAASSKIKEILSGNGKKNFRIIVEGGGCAGFQYNFELDDHISDNDHVIHEGNFSVVIDPTSLGLISGSTLEYIENVGGKSFKLTNPQAKSGCGCGKSFSLI